MAPPAPGASTVGYSPSDDGTATATTSSGYGLNRAGSPLSYQEPSRRLHVANAIGSPTEGQSADAGAFGPLGGATGGQARMVDGKGRIKLTADPTPIVHSDGGRILEVGGSGQGGQGQQQAPVQLPPSYDSLGGGSR